jgi:hypothetical protein
VSPAAISQAENLRAKVAVKNILPSPSTNIGFDGAEALMADLHAKA